MIVFKDDASDHVVAFDRACTMEEDLGSDARGRRNARFVTPAEFATWKEKKVMWGRQKLIKVAVQTRLKAEERQLRTERVQRIAAERARVEKDNTLLREENAHKEEALQEQTAALAQVEAERSREMERARATEAAAHATLQRQREEHQTKVKEYESRIELEFSAVFSHHQAEVLRLRGAAPRAEGAPRSIVRAKKGWTPWVRNGLIWHCRAEARMARLPGAFWTGCWKRMTSRLSAFPAPRPGQ